MNTPAPSPLPPHALSAQAKRFLRILVWVIFVYLLYAVAGFIAVPLLMKHYVPQALGSLTGRTVSVESASFNPFLLVAELQGLKVMEASHNASPALPAFEFGRLTANLGIASLWHGGPIVQELALENPRLHLVRLAEDRYNWSDVLTLLSAESPDNEQLPFSLANIHIENGAIELDDHVTASTHHITQLKLGLPAISRMSVKVDVFIKPDLSMLFDDHPLSAKGSLELYPDGFQGTLEQLSVKDLDLLPWITYLPFEPPFRLLSGTADIDMRLEFSQRADEAVKVVLRGRTQVNNLSLQDRTGRPLLAAAEMEAEMADIQPLIHRYHFSKLRLQKPELDIARLSETHFNIESLFTADTPKAAPGKTKTAASEKKQPRARPLDFQLSSARIRDGLIRYSDHAVPGGGFSTRIEGISLDLRGLSTSGSIPAEIRLDYTTASGEKFSHQDHLRLQPFEYEGVLTASGLQPAIYGRYYAPFLSGGEVRQGYAEGVFRYQIASRDAENGVTVKTQIERLNLTDFVFGLTGRKSELLKLKSLTLSDAALLPDEKHIQLGGIDAQNVALAITRLPNGRFDFMSLAGKPAPSSASNKPSSWTFSLENASISDSSIRFEDRTPGSAATVTTASGIELSLNGFSTAKKADPAKITLRGRINKDGRLALKGSFALEPFKTTAEFDLQNISLAPLQTYLSEQTQVGIKTGQLSAKGNLKLRQQRAADLSGTIDGQFSVRNFSSVDPASNQNFLRWNEFAVRQAKVELEPFALSIGEIAVDGLSSRLILDENGKLNLREIQLASGNTAPNTSKTETENAGIFLDEASLAQPAPAPETQNTPEPPADTNAPHQNVPPINIKRITVKNSNIMFSDRFVRPNYNAFLGHLSGELVGLSTDPATLAKLDLRGKIGQDAPVMVSGEFNPFRQDRHLNITADVKDFELTGLSGYAGRYIGYGITRGRLSATLSYKIEDRKLSAENHVFLDQLTFGDAVNSPDATHLPVRLAVSLLQNGRGEIDIKLPVGGTLDDPQFSVFGLVLRALAGLISKAVTAPFALLGQEELSHLEFAPGSARVGEAQETKLRELAKSLQERPTLKLDITGAANAQRDTEGIRRDKLRFMVMIEKRKTTGKGNPMDDIDPASPEYAALLGEVYKNAKNIKKPRNIIGMAKDLPVEEMEKLLLEGITVGPQDVAAMASRRETAVQRWLTDQGGIPPERVFRRVPTESEAKENAENNGVRFSLR
ncbi:MAG: DUF748 domain-containing protein [Azoarcus sp.]|jgi:uncharacterized protein involved in outer membrane biogenesis|nr:DUF748 domain-containing protein [Azoarcus sp.]